MKKELWKKVVGWPSYSVSTIGRVRRDLLYENRRVRIGIVNQFLQYGYPTVRLIEKKGHSTSRFVHRLILEAFIGPRPLGMESRHLDDVRKNSVLSNLKWGTHRENHLDMTRNGIKNGMQALSKEERSLAAKKSAETLRRKGIKVGFASLSKVELKKLLRRAMKTKIKNGIPIGATSTSAKKSWITRRAK